MRFEEVVKGWFFATHLVIFARIQHDLFPPRGMQLNKYFFVPLELKEFGRLGHIAAYDVIKTFKQVVLHMSETSIPLYFFRPHKSLMVFLCTPLPPHRHIWVVALTTSPLCPFIAHFPFNGIIMHHGRVHSPSS